MERHKGGQLGDHHGSPGEDGRWDPGGSGDEREQQTWETFFSEMSIALTLRWGTG